MNLDLNNPLCVENIRTCAEASRLVYDSPNVTGANGETALVQDRGNAILIAFPGTHDLEDIKEDLDCPLIATQINGSACRVHQGFDDSFHAIYPALNRALLGYEQKPIIGTGHSKGASVSRRVMLQLLEYGRKVFSFPTFGESRGGNILYAEISNQMLGNRSLRITNAADPVPWLPAWLAGNRHCGTEGWLPPGARPFQAAAISYGPKLWTQLLLNAGEILRGWKAFADLAGNFPNLGQLVCSWDHLRENNPLSPLLDHHIDSYIARLKGIS